MPRSRMRWPEPTHSREFHAPASIPTARGISSTLGKALCARRNFISLCIWDNRSTPRKMIKKGQTSHPPNHGDYFTLPPCICQDSLFTLGRALFHARMQLRG